MSDSFLLEEGEMTCFNSDGASTLVANRDDVYLTFVCLTECRHGEHRHGERQDEVERSVPLCEPSSPALRSSVSP